MSGFAGGVKKCLIHFLELLPPRFTASLGAGLGRIAYYLEKRGPFGGYMQRAVRRTLGVTEDEADRVVKANFIHMGKLIFELVGSPKLRKKWPKLLELNGREHLEAALSQGKGVILLSAHIGNFELLSISLPLLGFPPQHTIAWKFEDTFENRYLERIRGQYGTKLLYSQELKPNDVLGILNKGGIILIYPDHYTLGKTVAPFFGIPTHMPAGPVQYALATGAPLLPVYARREGLRTKITIEPPLVLPPADGPISRAIVCRGLKVCTATFERWIRTYPEQYFWLLKRNEWGGDFVDLQNFIVKEGQDDRDR
ncbi:MAG: lysophospholipid acyltransferase family protein [Firmicutes bacterium]|nr:lysophospholipid acyltransferase family protein [Bacillota bacterium]